MKLSDWEPTTILFSHSTAVVHHEKRMVLETTITSKRELRLMCAYQEKDSGCRNDCKYLRFNNRVPSLEEFLNYLFELPLEATMPMLMLYVRGMHVFKFLSREGFFDDSEG